jgi:acyl-CoA dehydrogenase
VTPRPVGFGLRRLLYDSEHDAFRAAARSFLAREAVPQMSEWETAGMPDRGFWPKAGAAGLLGFEIPAALGGRGLADFRYNAILGEESGRAGGAGAGLTLQNDIALPYLLELGNDEQHQTWLPRIARGEVVMALAVSEPHAGSDLRAMTTTARRDGNGYVVTGSKASVSGGLQADLVIVATCEGTLLLVEPATDGVMRSAQRDPIGHRSLAIADLHFNTVRVPAAARLGAEEMGFSYLLRHLPRERLTIAIAAVAAARHALELTLTEVRERHAFGRPIGSFQANRFALAAAATELAAVGVYVDRCIEALLAGELTPAEAAGVKAHASALQFQVLDLCLQLHGGRGYAGELPIARLWRDARAQRIYGGPNELMKDIVGRSIGL